MKALLQALGPRALLVIVVFFALVIVGSLLFPPSDPYTGFLGY